MKHLKQSPMVTAVGIKVVHDGQDYCIERPDASVIEKTSEVAKAIFAEAFETTYGEYHAKSGSTEPVETWLRLKEGLSLHQWLCNTYDHEVQEYKEGRKGFLHLCKEGGDLVGFLSHDPVSAEGELYLSQCSLEGSVRRRGLATAVFQKVFQENRVQELFPGAKVVKLITREINEAAKHLYQRAGFTMDRAIEPSVYGECYDDRYVGFRLLTS